VDIQSLVNILQASIAPCVLVSGLGLLLLSMTNRLARSIDRCRQLNDELQLANEEEAENLQRQVAILYERCLLLRTSIGFNIASVFFASLIVLLIFSMSIFRLNLSVIVELIFAFSLLSLISSLIFLFLDIRKGLNSLRIEIKMNGA